MILPIKMDYSLGTKVLYNTSSDSGELLKQTEKVNILGKSEGICQGIAYYALASATFSDETVNLQCKTFYINRVKLRCKADTNQSILTFIAENIGNPIVFHSKGFTGMLEYGCVNDNGDVELIVATLTTDIITATRKPSNPNIRFVMFNVNDADLVFSDMVISGVSEKSNQASYGDSGIVYNREVIYNITFASKKLKTENSKGEFLWADMVFFDLFDKKVVLKDVNPPVFSEQSGTIVVNSLKLAKTLFIFQGDEKSLNYSRGAYRLEIQADLL